MGKDGTRTGQSVPEPNKQSSPGVDPASVNNSSASGIITWAFRHTDIPQLLTRRLAFLFGPVWTVNVDSVELDHRVIDPGVTSACTRPTVHRDATHTRSPAPPLNSGGPKPLSRHGPHRLLSNRPLI